jgi:hypothetical protein
MSRSNTITTPAHACIPTQWMFRVGAKVNWFVLEKSDPSAWMGDPNPNADRAKCSSTNVPTSHNAHLTITTTKRNFSAQLT